MDTTICIKKETKELFLEKKRKVCATMGKDLTADEFLFILCGGLVG